MYIYIDAHVGAWIGVSEGAGVAERRKAEGGADVGEYSMLLLRRRVQEQHKPPESEASERFPNVAKPLQEEARDEALLVSQVREALGGER